MNNNFLPYQLKKNAEQNNVLATQLAQNTSQLANTPYDVKAKGGLKGDGSTTNDDVAINAALTNYQTVYIPDGTYYISNSINIPASKKLILSKNAIIKPNANVDMFILNDFSELHGGIVDIRSNSSFTKSVITISATIMSGIKVNGIKGLANYYDKRGTAINLDCTTDTTKAISFSNFTDFYFQGFKYGIYMNSTQIGNNFANGIEFTGVCDVCLYAVYNNKCDKNYYNIGGEACPTTNHEPSVYLHGNSNTLIDNIFDYGISGKTDVAIDIAGISNNVITDIPTNFIIDRSGSQNKLNQTIINLPTTKGIGTNLNNNTVFIGDQSNYLISADKQYTVSEILTNVTDTNGLQQMFRVNGDGTTYTFANPSSTTDNVEIDIDLGSANQITLFGLNMKGSFYAKQLILGVYSTYDSTWHEKTLYPSSGGTFFWNLGELDYTLYNSISKLRVKVYQPSSGTGNVTIYNLLARSSLGGNAFIPTHGGKLYGDLDLNKNKAKNMVLDSGATASRPTSPVVGQVFYDTTLGKPIYCKVGGASPTWTDSTGATV